MHLPSLPCLVLASLAGAAGFAIRADRPPQRPAMDADVVAVLRPSRLPAAERELRQWRETLDSDPTNRPLATSIANRCIQRFRDESDPRYLGAAAGALAPWWSQPNPGPELLLLRATVRQSLHDFDAAVADLTTAVRIDPRLAQAWLTLATLQCIRGEFAAARVSAVRLAGLGDPLTATTLAAHIASLTGSAVPARETLERVLERETPRLQAEGSANRTMEVWARTILAEISARLGDEPAAERQFKAAIEAGPRDPYLLAAYADFLLDHGRRDEVTLQLRGMERMDGLLLRLVEANRDPELLRTLADRLKAAIDRGDRTHLRETSRFELRLRNNPAVALRHAIDNWGIQREPADVRVLWEAALAAGDHDAMQEVTSWVRKTGLEDVALPVPGIDAARPHSLKTKAP